MIRLPSTDTLREISPLSTTAVAWVSVDVSGMLEAQAVKEKSNMITRIQGIIRLKVPVIKEILLKEVCLHTLS